MTKDSITALAPSPVALDPAWSQSTLANIVSVDRDKAAGRRRTRRRVVAGLAAGCLTMTTAAAIAAGGPGDVVRGVITDFSKQPNTTGNGLGELEDPELVAQFDTDNGLFALWVARSSTGKVCFAYSDGQWDGEGSPSKKQLEYGCDGIVLGASSQKPVELTRPDQLGGFFKDDAGPLLYGVSPYPDAVKVRVQGLGVDRVLPVRSDSHGYGSALPEADQALSVTLTFLDGHDKVLGSKVTVAPIG